jgi:hypothetical protein
MNFSFGRSAPPEEKRTRVATPLHSLLHAAFENYRSLLTKLSDRKSFRISYETSKVVRFGETDSRERIRLDPCRQS